MRKAKEIIQALRLTDTYPGEKGKQEIITAYLNEIFYGHGAYGIGAASWICRSPLRMTPAQAALLAGLPKSPTTLDPYRFAEPDAQGRLVVPPTAAPVIRRDWILRNLATSARWTRLTQTQVDEALKEPVVLAGVEPVQNRGGQFAGRSADSSRDPAGCRPGDRRPADHHDDGLDRAEAR